MDNSGTRLRTPFAHSLPLPLPLPLPSPALSWPGVMTPGGTPRPGPPSEMDAAIFAHGRKRRRAYKELAVLGQGSEATVKLARALETGELCALKVMTKPAGPERAKAECDMRRRFAAVQPLSAAHRHLPRYHELIESEHKWYFAMEHCPGGDLAGYVAARGGRIPESDAARVVAKLLDLLTTLHAHGIVHRDIKPSNVLLRDANDLDSLCLADFANCHVDLRFAVEGGIATPPAEQTKRLETVERNPFNTLHALSPITSEASLSGSTAYDGSPDPLPDEPECGDIGDTLGAAPMKTVTGTPFFLPPEIVQGIPYTSKVDMWALGALAYQLLFGRTPFQDAGSFAELYSRITKGQFHLPHGIVSDAAESFVDALLDTDPKQRPCAGEALKHPWIRGVDAVSRPKEAESAGRKREASGVAVYWDAERHELRCLKGSLEEELAAELGDD